MGKNIIMFFRVFFTKRFEDFKKSSQNIIPTLVEWDATPYNLKFNLRKRMLSFYFDLIIVLIVLGIVIFLFYK